MELKFKDFEVRPVTYVDGHIEPRHYELVKWYKTDEPMEVTDWKTGKKRMQDTFCYSIGILYWNYKEPCWEFESVGTRFLNDYVDGLNKFVLKAMELLEMSWEDDMDGN